MTERLRRDVKALVGVRVLNQLGAYVLPFLAVLAGHDLAAWALGVFGAAALVSRWLGGLLLDHLAPRSVIVLGLTATGATMLLLAGARDPGWVLAAVALVGLAFEIYEPATQESLARLTDRHAQTDVYGFLGTSLVASGAVGGLLAALLLPLGARWLIVADGLTCLLAAGVALALLTPDQPTRSPPRPPTTNPLPSASRIPGPETLAVETPSSNASGLAASDASKAPFPNPGSPASGREAPARGHADPETTTTRVRFFGRRGVTGWRPPGALVRLTAAGTAFACGYLAVLMFVPFVLLQRGAPAWLPGLTLTGAALVAPLTGRLGRHALRGLGHERVLVIGTVALGVLTLAMAVGRSVPLMAAGYLAWAAVDSVLQGRWPALIAETAPEADRPRWFAFHGSSWGIAQPAVPGLVALTGGAMVTAGAACLLVPLLLALPRRRHGRRPGTGRISGGRSPPARGGRAPSRRRGGSSRRTRTGSPRRSWAGRRRGRAASPP
ncbi:MFS transporter [Actinomadura sp. NEAU-AAG5]|uniref:MFS transporter n=1 Tax=Actinomadura litoris TaxID=2678616 RepID=A0A7K1KTH6_9ACTN|nr:MFS transporter [Actinomadura litoris]